MLSRKWKAKAEWPLFTQHFLLLTKKSAICNRLQCRSLTARMRVDLKIGDLVQCRDNHYNQGLGLVGRIGMAAELRKKDLRILFDANNQEIWLSKQGVNRIVLSPTDSPTLLERLSWLIHLVDAGECELEIDESGNHRLTLVCGELSLEKIYEIRDYVGALLVQLTIIPRGMSRLGLQVVFAP
jgi:hypothetical protein